MRTKLKKKETETFEDEIQRKKNHVTEFAK